MAKNRKPMDGHPWDEVTNECQAGKAELVLVYRSIQKHGENQMKRDHVENSVLPIDWTEVVGKVHEVLTQTESSAAEREKRLVKLTPPAVPTKERTKVWKHTLESFEERLQCFHAAVQKAEDNAVEADLALADAEKALEQWLVRSEKRTSVKNQPAAADRLRS